MKPIKLALFLTCVSLLYPQLFAQGAFSLKSCLLKAVFRIYFRSLLYPGTSVPVALCSVAFLEKPKLLLHAQALLKHSNSPVSTTGWRKVHLGAQHAFTPMKSPGPVLLVL